MQSRLTISGAPLTRSWLVAAVLGGSVAALAYWRRALTRDGAVAAALVGSIVLFTGRLPAAASLLAFFTSSSVLSRIGQGRKASAPLAQAKGARRDAWQVLANGSVATLCIALGKPQAFVGALAAAAADTWATEVGLLANRTPRLIIGLRPVPAGTSGGVTPEGLAASIGGALAVGLAWRSFGGDRRGLRSAVFGGTGGSLVDSLLGATLQALYRCPKCAVLTETPRHHACGGQSDLVRGWPWLTNDAVNALSTLAGAVIAATLSHGRSAVTRPRRHPRTPNAAGHVRGGV